MFTKSVGKKSSCSAPLIAIAIIIVAACTSLIFHREIPMPTDTALNPGPIAITSISEGDVIPPRFLVEGTASGRWFFEGVFPVDVENNLGLKLWQGYATADADADVYADTPIPFSAQIDIGTYRGPIRIVFMRDNPANDPSFDTWHVLHAIVR